MRTALSKFTQLRQQQNGSAVLIVLTLLGLMAALMTSNTASLNNLKREMDLIEKKQIKRCTETGSTNSPSPIR